MEQKALLKHIYNDSSKAKGRKVSKNQIFAFLSIFGFFAVFGIIFLIVSLWIPAGVFFGLGLILGFIFSFIRIQGIYLYVFVTRLAHFCLTKKNFKGKVETKQLFAYKYYNDNSLWTNKECITFVRVGAKNIANLTEEQKGVYINTLNNFFKMLDNNKITLLTTETHYVLNELDYQIDDMIEENINQPSITSLFHLYFLSKQLNTNFSDLQSGEFGNSVIPTPLDKVYLLGFHGSDYDDAIEKRDSFMNMLGGEYIYVKEAVRGDIETIINKTYSAVSTQQLKTKKNGRFVILDEDILPVAEKFSKFGSVEAFDLENAFQTDNITFKSDYFVFDKEVSEINNRTDEQKMFGCIIAIKDFNNDADLGWLGDIYSNSNITLLTHKFFSIHLNKKDKIVKKAKKHYGVAYLKNNGEENLFSNMEQNQEKNTTIEITQRLEKNDIALIQQNIYILITADTKSKLYTKREQFIFDMRKDLGLSKKQIDIFRFYQLPVFENMLVSKNDKLTNKFGLNLPSDALALGFPFQKEYIDQENGFLIGFDSDNTLPIFFEPTTNNGSSVLITGKVGGGKSFATKLIAMNLFLDYKKRVWFFDPQNEMANLTANLGGYNIDLSAETGIAIPVETNELKQELAELLKQHIKQKKDQKIREYNEEINGVVFECIQKLKMFETTTKEKDENGNSKRTPLLIEERDYFGKTYKGKMFYVGNVEANPSLLDIKNGLKTQNEYCFLVYKYIFENYVKVFSINPLRVRVIDAHGGEINPLRIFQRHKKQLEDWFETWIPNISSSQRVWISTSLTKVYKEFGVYEIFDEDTKEIKLSIEKSEMKFWNFPTMQDLYNVMLQDFNLYAMDNRTNQNNQVIKDKKLIEFDELLNVFDMLVPNNRLGNRGTYAHLWELDTPIHFFDNRFINFNCSKLNLNFKINNEDIGKLKINDKVITIAQFCLAYNIIEDFMEENYETNKTLEKWEKRSGYIFIDEFHKMTENERLFDKILDLVKTARKKSYGAFLITQDLNDFNKNADIKAKADSLMNNFSYKLFFATEGTSYKSIKDYFAIGETDLTYSELDWIKISNNQKTNRGKALLVANNKNRTMINVITANAIVGDFLENKWNLENMFEYTNENIESENFKTIIDWAKKTYNKYTQRIYNAGLTNDIYNDDLPNWKEKFEKIEVEKQQQLDVVEKQREIIKNINSKKIDNEKPTMGV